MSKFIILLFSISAMVLASSVQGFEYHERDLESDDTLRDLYERWSTDHHTVSRSIVEKHKRFNVFKQNVMHVHNTNKMNKPYKLKLNRFADMSNHEFRSTFAGSKIRHHRLFRGPPLNVTEKFMYGDDKPVPTSVDWRKKGAVTPIKDQGQCGNCDPKKQSSQF